MADVRLLVEFVVDGSLLPKKYQYSDSEFAIRTYLKDELNIEYGQVELLRNKVTGSAFLPRQWEVRAWVRLSDIHRLEERLAADEGGEDNDHPRFCRHCVEPAEFFKHTAGESERLCGECSKIHTTADSDSERTDDV